MRRLECVHGSMCFRVKFNPSFNYARDDHTAEVVSNDSSVSSVVFKSKDLSLVLHSSDIDLSLDKDGKNVDVEFCITEAHSVTFVLKIYE